MSSQGPLPFMEYNGVEVSNAARTVEYLRNGLGNTDAGHWTLGPGDLCSVLYRLDTVGCQRNVFVSPTADPAPWYLPAPVINPAGAEDFLGVVLTDLTGYDSTRTRIVTERVQGLGGGTFSGERKRPREWKFQAALISSSDQGAEYGLRWLTYMLGTTACDTCGTSELVVRLSCPPDDCSDDTIGEWIAYDTVLTDGPHEVEKWAPRPESLEGTLAGCRVITVQEWTLVSGNPFLYKRPQLCLEQETLGVFSACNDICDWLFGDPGEPHCCTIDQTPLRGQVIAPIFTFSSVSGMGDIIVGAYEDCPTDVLDGSPVALMQIAGVPAGGTVVVDCSRREISSTYPDPDTGDLVTVSGDDLIVLSEGAGVQWPQADDCNNVTCFCARTAHPCSQGGDTTVQIDTQLREA